MLTNYILDIQEKGEKDGAKLSLCFLLLESPQGLCLGVCLWPSSRASTAAAPLCPVPSLPTRSRELRRGAGRGSPPWPLLPVLCLWVGMVTTHNCFEQRGSNAVMCLQAPHG